MTATPQAYRLADPAPLEDEISYVWRKALRGRSLDAAGLATRCQVPTDAITALIAGKAEPALVKAAAAILGLHEPAIRGLSQHRPKVAHVHGVTRLALPFEGDFVNAWLIRDEDHTLLFDTGFERDSAAVLLQRLGAADVQLFLTHDHRDHVGGLMGLQPLLKKQHQMNYGQSLRLGSLEVQCIDLSGHCLPTYGYVIRGLSKTFCVVGDALFAGSIGGCADSYTYEMALRNLQHHVMSLPDDVILLPGHGPATTVAQEKRGNPFVGSI